MNEETLNSFDLTPAEMDTFAALQSFNASEEQQLQLPQQQQEQQQQQYVDDSQPGLYFDMIDPRLVSNAPTPMASHMSPGSGSELDPATSFLPTAASNEDKLASGELGHFYPDPTTAGTAYSGTPFNNIGDNNPYGSSHEAQYDMGVGSANPLRHQLLGHRRSISVPPEEPGPAMVFTRAGTPLGESTNPSYPSTPGRLLKATARKRKLESARHGSYGKRGRGSTGGGGGRYELRRSQTQPVRGGGPTSAPSPSQYPPEMIGVEEERDDHSFQQSSRPLQPQRSYVSASWFGDPLVPSTASWSAPKQVETFAEREKAWFERVDVRELLAKGDSGGVSTTQVLVLARLDQLGREFDDLRIELRGLLKFDHEDDEVERYVLFHALLSLILCFLH